MSQGKKAQMQWNKEKSSLCIGFSGPVDFHSVRQYSNSAGPNVRHGFQSFRNLCMCDQEYSERGTFSEQGSDLR